MLCVYQGLDLDILVTDKSTEKREEVERRQHRDTWMRLFLTGSEMSNPMPSKQTFPTRHFRENMLCPGNIIRS